MKQNFVKRVAANFGMPGVLGLAIALLVLLPFDLVALTRLTGWEWWAAIVALLILNLVPLAGQLTYLGLAVLGAFYLGQDDLAARRAAKVSSPVSEVAAVKATDKFVEWKRTVAAPAIQDDCIAKARSRGLIEGRQIEQMAKVCACYGAAAINILEQSDVVDDVVQPSPTLTTRMSDEARRLCQG